MILKSCRECKVEKNIIEFYKNGSDPVCKICRLESNRIYRLNNRVKIYNIGKIYRYNNRERLSEKNKKNRESIQYKENYKQWKKDNPDKIKSYRDKYKKSDKCKQHRKNWYKSIKKRSPHILAWRALLNNSLKRLGKIKEEQTIIMLGYSALELKQHLESLFIEGMSWENYGEWHIDHIKMICTFDKDTPPEIVNSLSNIRPLWMSDNCSKKLN